MKTSNVLLDEGRRAGFLSDFERAARMTGDGSTQAILATPFYMAPECAVSGRHTVRSDIYGVGVILFEMLNGRFPWESFSRTEIERRILAGKRSFPDRLVALAAFAPEIPDELVRITRKAISRDPAGRFASARAFLDALNQARCMDWRRQAPSGSDRQWIGAWPPLARISARDRYRVTSRVLTSGKHKNELRLVAEVQKAGSVTWCRFGIGDRSVGVDDNVALRQFFIDVAAKAAQRRPAR